MSPKLILCRFEPDRFPIAEFMKDQQGNIVFPYIHITRQPIHFANGQLVPSYFNPGSPDSPSQSGTPYIPTAVPPSYIPILPAMVERFNEELEKYLQDREQIGLAELLDFGQSLDLESKKLDLVNLFELKINRMPKEVLNDTGRLLDHLREVEHTKFNRNRFKIDDSKFGSGRGGFGGFGGSGGLGGPGGGGIG